MSLRAIRLSGRKVVRKLRSGSMPPEGAPRPDRATSEALVGFLESRLDRAAFEHPNPGRPLVHRLNRAEYANAIRDLLALEVDPATLLPPDDSADGFDNIADVLSLSPSLLEGYLSAAAKISAPRRGQPEDHREFRDLQSSRRHVADRTISRACRSAHAAACPRCTPSHSTASMSSE